MPRSVTSISVDQDLWKAARIFAINKGLSVSDLIEIALRTFMANPPEEQIQRAAISVAEARSEQAKRAWNTIRSKRRKNRTSERA